jgi:lipid II:glycine glycyltransferase (peptidoglycan interpeptide bridge formation enzyme)
MLRSLVKTNKQPGKKIMTVHSGIQANILCLKQSVEGDMAADYQAQISSEIEDREWDAFLAHTTGGHHVQTSLWAQVKAQLGWKVARLIVRCDGNIVAGAQVLIRPVPMVGTYGYLSKGPIFIGDDPFLVELVIRELKHLVKIYRIRNLVMQPPDNGQELEEKLADWGFLLSPDKLGLSATVVLDLDQDLDNVLAQMKSKTRYNIRLGRRKGISVREGTEQDMSAFYQMLSATGQRQGFVSNSENYYLDLWRILEPHGYCKLFLAEYQGEPVSGLLAITFGDTVLYKRGAWNGSHGNLRPNEVMHWSAIEWAKSQGYRFYDFEGIEPYVAKKMVQGEPIPSSATQSVTRFKIGFGGEIRILPETYSYIGSRLLKWSYRKGYPKIASWQVTKKAVTWVRSR